MAKFLTTVGNSFYIEQIIKDAERDLTLVTPYLSLSENLLRRLIDAHDRGVHITLIYGKTDLPEKERKKLLSLKNLSLLFCQNLHAKCYYNESLMIISSMNLYEFSERNNREMGILIERVADETLYVEAKKEVESIANTSIVKKRKEEMRSNLIYLDDSKTERWNFHLPSLKRLLEDQFQEKMFKKEDEDSVFINDFPVEGVKLEISGRIDFDFEDGAFYQYLKREYKDNIEEASRGNRFYWNHNRLNIYPEKDFDVEVSEKGLLTITNKYWKIIQNTAKLITIANNH